MIPKLLAVLVLHAGLIYFFRDIFGWYWENATGNPYYNFSLFFVAFWLAVHFFSGRGARAKDMPIAGLLLCVALWVACLIWRGPYFSAVCFIVTSLLAVRWTFPSRSEYLDVPYSALLFTLPFPFYAEVLAFLQLFALKGSLSLCGILGQGLEHDGSLVMLKDGPVRIAAACSGFQSLVVLFALGGLFSYFARLTFAGKFVTLAGSILVAVGCNIARVTSMLLIGKAWGVSTAVNYWHGISAWIFYLAALGGVAALAAWSKSRWRIAAA